MRKKASSEKKASPEKKALLRRIVLVGLWIGVAVGAFFIGRTFTSPNVQAQSPYSLQARLKSDAKRQFEADRQKRVVAYIYDNVPVTRAELGDYLIERYGAQSLNLLINRKIIETECRKKGITVTPEEVNAAMAQELQKLGLKSEKQFKNNILKRYRKTLYEWKQDVVKPRLMLTKYSMGRVQVSKKDINEAYEAYYGAKVRVQMILWPVEERKRVFNEIWEKISKDPKEFDRAARKCCVPSLASRAGKIDPIGRNTTGDPGLEKVIFSLKKGEVSEVVQSADGKMLVVVKCLGHIPAKTDVRLADVRGALEKEIREKKISMEIGQLFESLRNRAKPKIYVERFNPDDGVVPNPKKQATQISKPAGQTGARAPRQETKPSTKVGTAPMAPPTPVSQPGFGQ